MKIYIISGEASGDLHGSNLIKAIKAQYDNVEFRVWGGDKMEAEGATLVKHYKDLAFMGFAEVLMNLRTILRNLSFCKSDIKAFHPDVLILIDYPGFNLRIAKYAKEHKIPVLYYIAPQIWAWNQGRVHNIVRSTDQIATILPFEKSFYKKFGYDVDYVGHPLLDEISTINKVPEEKKKIISMLPGSRVQEIKRMLPIMLQVAKRMQKELKNGSDYQFVIAGVNSLGRKFYEPFLKGYDFEIRFGETYHLLQHSKSAMVTSGTAALESTLFDVPIVVCYKASEISYQIAKRLVKVNYISIANLVMEKEVNKELIQNDLTEENLFKEMELLTENEEYRNSMLADYEVLRTKLGGKGASEKTAKLLLKTLENAE